MPHKLTDSKRFCDFIHSRDLSLEKIFLKYQVAINNILNVLLDRSQEIAAHINTKSFGIEHAKANRAALERKLSPLFHIAALQAVSLIKDMRRTTYVLSYVGQSEAIGRARGKETKSTLTRADITDAMHSTTPSGGDLLPRVDLYFHRLLRKVVDAFQLSQVLSSTPQEALERIARAFPTTKKIAKRAPLAKIKEAAGSDEDPEKTLFFSFGTIDPELWEKTLQDYYGVYLPFGRSPYDTVFYPVEMQNEDMTQIPEDLLEGYQWELENEMTQDFVQQVRDGEIDSANDNGIDDFVWIAIIDDKTDECCVVRDGLTTSQIEMKLDNGDDMGDCDETSPPAHFNCRCRVAPVDTETLPEVTPPDYGSFDDFLSQKAMAG